MWRQRVAFGRYALAVTAPGGAGARGGGRAGSVSREARTWSSRRGRAGARGRPVDGIRTASTAVGPRAFIGKKYFVGF